jgi:hypothetical protein
MAAALVLPLGCEEPAPLGPIETGPTFLLPAPDGPRLLVVTRREKQLRRGGRSERVHAELRDARTLERLARERLATVVPRTQPGFDVLGATPSRLWVLDEGALAGFDAATLAKVVDRDALVARAPALAAQLPAETQYFAVARDGGSLAIRARDATDWSLDPETLVATPGVEPDARPRDFDPIGAAGPFALGRALSYRDLLADSGLFGDAWIGTFAPEDIAGETRWDGTPSTPHGEQRRRLYRAPFEREPGPNEWAQIGAHVPLGDPDADFLDGALLRDATAFRALALDAPPSFLVISKTELGVAGRIVVARFDTQGGRLWECELPLARVSHFGARDGVLVLLGVEHEARPAPARRTRIAAVDLADGSLALAWAGGDE